MRRLAKWLTRRNSATSPELSLEARFTTVFDQRLWGSDESASGMGSELNSGQVAHAMTLLRRIIPELGIRSIADVPCGDFNWMPVLLREHPEIDYRGYDIVPALVNENRSRHPAHVFSVLDITRQSPDRVDLIFTKDLINHLSEKDIWSTLKNMVGSQSSYLMITNNTGMCNVDLEPSQAHASRYVDLLASPYDMPEPIYADHYFLIWPMTAIRDRLADQAG